MLQANRNIRNKAYLAVMGLCALAISGCATQTGTQNNTGETAVKERAQARWDALIKWDIPAAYQYLSPGTRETTTLDQYRTKMRNGSWKKASVDTVQCAGDRCEVVILMEYTYRGMTTETRLNEIWVQSEGSWWHVPRK